MADRSDEPVTPDRTPRDKAIESVSPSSDASSSSGLSPDVAAFLANLRAAGSSDTCNVNNKLEAKRKEREHHKAEAKVIARDLKRLRNQKSKAAKKTKGATTDELLQALSDRAASANKVKNEKKLELVPEAATNGS
jgi:hypothetical protein